MCRGRGVYTGSEQEPDAFLTHKAVALQRYFFAASDFCKRLGSYPDRVRRLEFNFAPQGSRLQLFHGGN